MILVFIETQLLSYWLSYLALKFALRFLILGRNLSLLLLLYFYLVTNAPNEYDGTID